MKADDYTNRLDGYKSSNRKLVLALMVLAGLNVVNLVALMGSQSKVQTVIVPIGSEGMQIGNGRADERYLRRMARYITNQVGTYTAGSARHQFQEVLHLFAPTRATEVAKYFDKIASDIERYPSISSNFVWSGDQALKTTSKMIQVRGQKERLVNGTVTERNQVHYCIAYHINDSTFFIDRLDENSEQLADPCFLDRKKEKADNDEDNNA